MVRTKDSDGIKSSLIVTEVQKRPCLFDTNHSNYGDRAEKSRCWEEVCVSVVPGWCTLGLNEKFAAGKEVQKRWRSIRDSYTKAYRQGKCAMPEQCAPGSRRYNYHREMAFLLRALQNKKPRYSQDKYESMSEMSNSPQHPPPDETPKPNIKIEIDKPMEIKTNSKPEEKLETLDKCNQASIDNPNPQLEIKIDANSILPDDHFDDDKSFMNSLLPLFKKMDDDTRLFCRIEVLKTIRYALQGNKSYSLTHLKPEPAPPRLHMTTRSADGSRPIRKRKDRSPSPLPTPPKRRGPGRPRKIRPPPSESDEETPRRRGLGPTAGMGPLRGGPDTEDPLGAATSVAQLSTPLFMKMYNLSRSINAPSLPSTSPVQISIKTEPVETPAAPN